MPSVTVLYRSFSEFISATHQERYIQSHSNIPIRQKNSNCHYIGESIINSVVVNKFNHIFNVYNKQFYTDYKTLYH